MKTKDRYIFAAIMLFLFLVLVGLLFYKRSLPEDPGTTTDRTDTNVIQLPNVTNEPFSDEVTFVSGDQNLKGFLCKPKGKGPFPVVIYNHGGTGGAIGGVPEETCDFLKKSEFVGFSPIRRKEPSLQANLMDVKNAVDFVRQLNFVDNTRLGLMGFSRGGLLTFLAAGERDDLKAVVIMAGAPPPKEDLTSVAKKFSAPTLILVAKNDTPNKLNGGQDLVKSAKQMKEALEVAEKEVELIIYPPYEENGHLMFFEIGDYWEDVVEFLEKHLKD